VVPRSALIEGVWGYDREIEDNTLDVFVRLLRQKVEAGGRSRIVHTVRGVGYCVREEPPA
jgi:DNA-binding response OmpR family regulator